MRALRRYCSNLVLINQKNGYDVSNWTLKNSGVQLTNYLKQQINLFAEDLSFPIVITSGVRTASTQASAMFGKIEAGDSDLGLYLNRDFANGVVTAYPDLEKATQVVSEYASAGGGSTHLRAQAFDVRTRDLSVQQIAEMQTAAIEKLDGARAILELQPPHLHVTVAPPPKKSPLIALGLIAIGLLYWSTL